VFVHLVGEDTDVVLLTQTCNHLEFVAAKNPPCRVVRRIQY
jgi:hypothetical protein